MNTAVAYYCSSCGRSVDPFDLFGEGCCSFCGNPLTDVQEQYLKDFNKARHGPASGTLSFASSHLQSGNWDFALSDARSAIELEPNNYLGYLYQLMAEVHSASIASLELCDEPFDHRTSYLDFKRVAPYYVRSEINFYLTKVQERCDPAHGPPDYGLDDFEPEEQDNPDLDELDELYRQACFLLKRAVSHRDYRRAGELFYDLGDYADAVRLYRYCSKMSSELQTNGAMSRFFKSFFVFLLICLFFYVRSLFFGA